MLGRKGSIPPFTKSVVDRQTEMLQNAITFHKQGKLLEARKLYALVLKKDRNNFDALHLSGVISYQLGDLEKAISNLSRALKIKPGSASLHLNYGAALHQAKRYVEALQSYNEAISSKTDYADAFYNRANLLYEMHRFDDALESYDKTISIRSNHWDAFYNRGNALRELKRFSEALQSYDKALALKPNYALGFNNQGVVLQEMQRFDEALRSYEQAILIKPDYTEAYINRANALKDMRRLEEASQSYEKAMLIDPKDAESHWNAALFMLLMGNFSSGLPLYEWRKFKLDPLGDRTYHRPLWRGAESLSNKTILVHWEQGFGDTIQFCRYVGELTVMGANVLFAPQKPLKKLMSMLNASVQIVDVDDKTLKFDFHCPLLSLPFALKTELATIPDQVPYLNIGTDLIAHWKQKIGVKGFKIGICWQGSTGKADAGRSFSISHLESMSRIPGVRLISLHKGEGAAQLQDLPEGMTVETFDLDAGPDAFVDTAAAINCCDLIISSDTAVAHLAGALGVNTWIAIKHIPDWRWMLDRNDSPWYPTMRLFRQDTHGDWDGVFSRIADAIRRSP